MFWSGTPSTALAPTRLRVPPPVAEPRRVLVIHASVEENESIVRHLRASQVDAYSAYDATSGFRDALILEPHVLVIDLTSPIEIDEELIARLVGHPSTNATPIVLLLDPDQLRGADDVACLSNVRRILFAPSAARVARTVQRLAS